MWRQNNPCAIDALRSRIECCQPIDCWTSSQHTKLCTYTHQPYSAFPSRPQSTVTSILSDAIPNHAAEPSPRRERRSWSSESRHQTPPLQRRQPSTYHPPCHASTVRSCPNRHSRWSRYTIPLWPGCPYSSADVHSSACGHDAAASSRELAGPTRCSQSPRPDGSAAETRYGIPAAPHVTRPHHA